MPSVCFQTTPSPAHSDPLISLDREGFCVVPQGPFSLREAALFGFGQRHDTVFDGHMRLAFCVDGLRAQAAVVLTQAPDGRVHGRFCGVRGEAAPQRIARQVLRVLSLDHDARGFLALGDRDPVLRKLLGLAAGLRPVLFYSPYEAALWAVLSARRSYPLAQRARQRLCERTGARFELAGMPLWAAPLPERLIELGVEGICAATGIEPLRAQRVHAIAGAMRHAAFGADSLARLEPELARGRLRQLPGIGPFFSDLILVRATGVTDVLPVREPRLLELLSALYGVPDGETVIARLARNWSPWRTWVAVLVRAAGVRLRSLGPAIVERALDSPL